MRSRYIAAISAMVLVGGCARTTDPLSARVLSQDWEALAKPGAAAPYARVLAAHALLALNRNNESVCAFDSLTSGDLREWNDWTAGFVRDHPRAAVAHYLRGDALARQQSYKAALDAFDQALSKDPKHALSFNARGVVRAITGRWRDARDDLYAAARFADRLADAHASRGFLFIHQKQSAEGAAAAFEKALQLSPGFALASAGKTFAEIAMGAVKDKDADLLAVLGKSPCAPALLSENLALIASWAENNQGRDSDPNAGTQIDGKLQQLKAGNLDATKSIAEHLGRNPQDAKKFGNTMAEIKKSDPAYANKIVEQIQKFQDLNKPGGKAETFGNLLKGLGGEMKSETSTQLNGSLKGNIGVAKGELGGKIERSSTRGLSLTTSHLGEQMLKNTETNLKGWNAMESAARGGQGGATSSLAPAHFDEGDWPFAPVYGLLYGRGAR
jgi:tetratricopeptide (TPR) repeat protein